MLECSADEGAAAAIAAAAADDDDVFNESISFVESPVSDLERDNSQFGL